jgi:hypothetical protein
MAIFTHGILTNMKKKKLKLQKLSLSKFITKIIIFLAAMKLNLTLGKTSSSGVGRFMFY